MVYRDYNAGELEQINIGIDQEKGANFRDSKTGKLFLVRCYACGDPEYGRENHMSAVAGGYCAWCGWSEDSLKEKDV